MFSDIFPLSAYYAALLSVSTAVCWIGCTLFLKPWWWIKILVYTVWNKSRRSVRTVCTCVVAAAGVRVGVVRDGLRAVHWPWVAAVRSAVPSVAQLRATHSSRQDPRRARRHRNHHTATQLPRLLRRLRRKRLLLVAGQLQLFRFRWHPAMSAFTRKF